MSDDLYSLPEGPSDAIRCIIQKHALNNVKVSVENAVPKGQNYSGVIYRVIVNGEKDGGDVTTSYIIKVASDNESVRIATGLSTVYLREIMYYTELFSIYQRMQDEVGIPFEDQFRFAKCYHADKEYLKEFIIFEDLTPLGFVTTDRKCEMDYEHASCALETYGKFHALSFALKKREPEKFNYFTENVPELLILKDNKLTNIFIHACEKAIPVVEKKKNKDFMENLKDNIVNRLLDTLTQNEFSVLSHSDCWSANMMFKYENGKPIKTCLLDFQICRYGSPTIDVIYYIFANTGHKLRAERYEELLSVYHNAMKIHLELLSYDVEQIYPWKQFKQDLKKSSVFGLVVGLSIAMMTLSDEILVPDDFVDFGNSPLVRGKVSNTYRDRVNGILEDFMTYESLS